MIKSLLVANRGEIARRILRTCRDLGIRTVAVFSDPDAAAPHVAEADAAVRLAGARPEDTYLNVKAILDAARAAGADAVHPGYGFLSENAAFARAVVEAGLTWVGPPPEAIEAMGSKISAKRLMAEAGVPVQTVPDDASAMTMPVMVKAAAGGGGRGMRIVRDHADLAEAIASAEREALAAFGDGTVFVEPLLEGARHIEVQILADAHGTVWALGERECSIQRRHQKVIEETPSPGVGDGLRTRLCAAAVAAARAIGYVGAGTVEFLVSSDIPGDISGDIPGGISGDLSGDTTEETIAFLEMNTRLQVEHPITECVYGIDLVRLQLEIAEGARLPETPPVPHGHAIEARLYAEDPSAGWRPESGVLHRFAVPGVDAEFGLPTGDRPFLRLDSGVTDGSVIGTHYDAMLAKVIAWAPTRATALRRLTAALADARLHGVPTNRDLLLRVLAHEAFRSGATHTGFLDEHAHLATTPPDENTVKLSALAAALATAAADRRAAPVLRGLPLGWRNVPSLPQTAAFQGPCGTVEVAYRLTRDGLHADGFDDVTLADLSPEQVTLESAGVRHRFDVARHGDPRHGPALVHVDSPLGAVRLRPLPRLPEPAVEIAPGSLLAPMPGTVLRVDVAPGETVEAGRPVVVLEAMKMEHVIAAPMTGTVSAVHVTPGRQVEAGALLALVEPAKAESGTASDESDTATERAADAAPDAPLRSPSS
ncbi:biotin carboxylase N-terminal domain-containing protein [Thermopolyspora sp. NPDC052614]|uniref:acetyl/propionyl/methylcrotonyl-CoA carboxylase subunit alpha n=1 Tax=Thermopolyspora sp. NPDC052614 TaxID=3155682 RepID=UPI003432EB00